jgi:signal transduction histidine kinase
MLYERMKKYLRSAESEHEKVSKKSYAKDFALESCMLNIQRLRFWSLFLLLLVVLQFASDFFFQSMWSEKQLAAFRFLDIYLGIITFAAFYISHFHRPDTPGEVTSFHKTAIRIYIFSHLLWSALVSGIESETANGLPTYLLGVFSAASIFIIPWTLFLAALLTSLSGLIVSFYIMQVPILSVIERYYIAIVLVIIAFIISRILYNSRFNNFITRHQLETTNRNLDDLIKQRTKELSSTNLLLKNEIAVRIRFEKELKKTLLRAEESDRLKSIFLANMSHEIRTPLNGILGFSDLLMNMETRDKKSNRYLTIIHKCGEQLLQIIDDIIDISLIESNQLKIHNVTFHLNDLLKDTYEFFSVYKKTHERDNLIIKYTAGRPDGDDFIHNDPGRINQILNNLVKNSVKFTEKGTITFGYTIKQPAIVFFVEDTGTGIGDDLKDKLFTRFTRGEYSLTQNISGTGLGLAISRGITECLGGSIWHDQNYAPGARFCFSIPYSSSDITDSPENKKDLGTNFLKALKNLGLR